PPTKRPGLGSFLLRPSPLPHRPPSTRRLPPWRRHPLRRLRLPPLSRPALCRRASLSPRLRRRPRRFPPKKIVPPLLPLRPPPPQLPSAPRQRATRLTHTRTER